MDIIESKVKQKISKPLVEVFKAIVKADKMSCYFISHSSGDMIEGIELNWTFGDAGVEVSVKVDKIEKPGLIRFFWGEKGKESKVVIELLAVELDETLVEITETGWPLNKEGVSRALQQTQGWTHMLMCLKAYLEFGINLRAGSGKC